MPPPYSVDYAVFDYAIGKYYDCSANMRKQPPTMISLTIGYGYPFL